MSYLKSSLRIVNVAAKKRMVNQRFLFNTSCCRKSHCKSSLMPRRHYHATSIVSLIDEKYNNIDPKDKNDNDISDATDYFKIMGIKRSFHIPRDELKAIYKSLMRKFHPDRHTLKSRDEQDAVAEEATKISRGYGVLEDDHERALHLLELSGMPMEENISGDIVGQEFLFEIMELREEVDNASSEIELKELLIKNKKRMNDTSEKLGAAFAANNLIEAKRLTAILQYWKRIDELIIERL